MFSVGFFVGALFVAIVATIVDIMYRRLLVMKSKDKSSECIYGEFFVIVPEAEYLEMTMLIRALRQERIAGELALATALEGLATAAKKEAEESREERKAKL